MNNQQSIEKVSFTRIENYVLDAMRERDLSLSARAVCIDVIRTVLAANKAACLSNDLKPVRFLPAHCPYVSTRTFYAALTELAEKGFLVRLQKNRRPLGAVLWMFTIGAVRQNLRQAKSASSKNGTQVDANFAAPVKQILGANFAAISTDLTHTTHHDGGGMAQPAPEKANVRW